MRTDSDARVMHELTAGPNPLERTVRCPIPHHGINCTDRGAHDLPDSATNAVAHRADRHSR